MAEIDDAELETLRKSQGLLDGLLRNPKTKRNTERELKKLHPELVVSDDFDAPVLDEIRAIGAKVDGFLKAQNESAVDGRLAAEFDALRRDGGYTDEGIEKIKAIMKERTIPDPMAAAALYEKLNPAPKPQRPSSFNGMGWGIGAPSDEPDTKLLFDDEDAWTEQEAGRFFTELAATK